MYVVEYLKSFLRSMDKMNDMVEFAIKVQSGPPSEKATEILAGILELIQEQGQHIHRQLQKGIAVEKELENLGKETKDLRGVEIFVAPWFSEAEPEAHIYSAN